MIERDWSTTVEATLSLLGWRWCHFRVARTKAGWRTPMSGSVGFPDIVAVRGERVVYIELKSDSGRLRPEQKDWIGDLEAAGQEVYVWRPSDDWAAITEILRRDRSAAA